MKKFALALIATFAIFGATAYATPAQAATAHPASVPGEGGEFIITVDFDHYPPSTYMTDSGSYGYLINVRMLDNGWYEGTYHGYY